MSEKRSPHHDLESIRAIFSTTKGLRITGSAMRDAFALGYDAAGIVRVIRSMRPRHFYKSMTANQVPGAWQDVYHVPDGGRVLYVKFTDNAIAEMTLLSFKAK